MKISSLKLTNFSKYDSVEVSFDPNVTYLVGKNGSGKSTLGITGIHFMFMGIAEKASDGKTPLIGERFRFIGPKAATARGEMTLYDEAKGIEIKVMRKLTKTGTELSFQGPEGMELGQQWLNDLFNVFLIAPKRFCELAPKDQAKALGVITKPFDEALAMLKSEYSQVNAVYRSYGELPEPERVDKVDVEALQVLKDEVRKTLNQLYADNKLANKTTEKDYNIACNKIRAEWVQYNLAQDELSEKYQRCYNALKSLVAEGYTGGEVDTFLETLRSEMKPQKTAEEITGLFPKAPINLADMPADYQQAEDELVYVKELPDDTKLQQIDKLIADASETNRKALLYEQWKEAVKKKEACKADLDANKAKQEAKEGERIAYIKSFKFPFSNISVGDDGELLLAGKPIKEPYFSTGEILKVVPILLSTANPDLKYVFLQDFNLMDDEKQADIEKYLTDKGFQLVVEMVGKAPVADKNCILLRDNVVVENYDEVKQPELI